jgi:uncharacterized protein
LGLVNILELLPATLLPVAESLVSGPLAASGPAFSTEAFAWEMPPQQIAWSVIIVAMAAFIQATVGFAAALFGLPLLLWAGNNLMEAQVLIISAMLPQNVFAVWKLRKSIDVREIIVPATIRIGALPIGIAGLAIVLTWSTTHINQFVGLLILLAVVAQALVGIEWKNAKKPVWMVIVFGGSGFLQGISGLSGPPMVLWVHGQRYPVDRARAFLFSMYITNFIPQVLLLWWKFGNSVFEALLLGLWSLPLVLLGATLGLRLGSWLGDRWLRPATYACLVWLALCSLLEPWLRLSLYPWLHTLFHGQI